MNSEKILILYKDGNYKWKKLKKLSKNDMNKKEIKYLLIPSPKNPLLFYTILPDNRLLSEKFHIQLTVDIANIDFENDYFDFIDRFESEYTTESLFDFIEFISIFYKINGVSETMESSWLSDGMSDVRTMYPVHYRIEFINHNKITDIIDSGELPNYTKGSELKTTSFDWIINGRMDAISDILLTWDCGKNSIARLPILLTFKDDKWNKIKYANSSEFCKIEPDDLIMIRLDGYGSYYLANYRMYNILKHIESFTMDLIVVNSNDSDLNLSLYVDIGKRLEHAPQVERDAFCRYIKEELCSFYNYTYILGDIYSFIVWLVFAKDIINYIHALFHTLEDDSFVICIRHLSKMMNYTFSEKDIMLGKFQEYLSKYAFERNMYGGNLK